MSNIIDVSALDPARRTQLRALTQAPKLSWPTVSLWLILTATIVVTDVLAVRGVLSLWVGLVINTAVSYLGFSVAHDAIHRSISTDQRLNDWIGRLAIPLTIPYVSLGLFRWAHIQHHRFTNDPRDPDRWCKGPWWQLPWRWAFIDLSYFVQVTQRLDKVSRPYFRDTLILAALTFALVGTLVHAGYGREVLMLWFIPSRLIFILLGFTFFWLPHVPHDTAQAENFTRATTIREGHEWLLSPLLQYQNFHLIHHLYPATPFYNNGRVWQLLEPELRRRDLAIQHGFAIRPTLHPGAIHA
jgi:fatty acid desaturase